jgi:hypothetical protein
LIEITGKVADHHGPGFERTRPFIELSLKRPPTLARFHRPSPQIKLIFHVLDGDNFKNESGLP